ncbi:hypothetical protein QVD17_32237 [Tagetes erecta]|uniref:Uncharacterized protein n=1 Tax=Tagetes erecta TaxID=13708 RepID=A0AAD8NPY5_TARER|nr:hypothetical protein QVD17_32237 [Tagetes erecta]
MKRKSHIQDDVNNVVEIVLKTDMIMSDSGGDDVKKHVGCQSEDGLVTDPQFDQETEPIDNLDIKCDVTTSQEFERGLISGFDLNEEFCFEEKLECSLSGTDDSSKQRLVCHDIDLNVCDDNEDKDVNVSSVDACPWKPILSRLDLNMCQSLSQSCSPSSSSSSSSNDQSSMKNFDLNNVASLDHQKHIISLFGTQVEVNHNMSTFAPFFVMSVAGPSQQNMGLDLGLTMNGGNNGVLSGSLVGRKRQEPEGGWEAFLVNYKHQHPPWK